LGAQGRAPVKAMPVQRPRPRAGTSRQLPRAPWSRAFHRRLSTTSASIRVRLAGWLTAGHMRASLVTDALEVLRAAWGAGRLRGAVFPSTNGAQCTSEESAPGLARTSA
ncbi:hypothetical protein ABZ582_35305, partial [Streptomyces syringium]